ERAMVYPLPVTGPQQEDVYIRWRGTRLGTSPDAFGFDLDSADRAFLVVVQTDCLVQTAPGVRFTFDDPTVEQTAITKDLSPYPGGATSSIGLVFASVPLSAERRLMIE